MPDENTEISADDWGAAMAEQAAAASPASTPAQPHVFQQLGVGAGQGATHNDLDMIMDIPVQLSV